MKKQNKPQTTLADIEKAISNWEQCVKARGEVPAVLYHFGSFNPKNAEALEAGYRVSGENAFVNNLLEHLLNNLLPDEFEVWNYRGSFTRN